MTFLVSQQRRGKAILADAATCSFRGQSAVGASHSAHLWAIVQGTVPECDAPQRSSGQPGSGPTWIEISRLGWALHSITIDWANPKM